MKKSDASAIRLARADIAEVDVVLESLGEIGNELEALQRIEVTLDKMRALSQQLARQQTRQSGIAAEIVALAGSAERSLAAGLGRVRRELGETRDAAQRLRLVPVTSIFTTLERTARDAAHHTGKQVMFHATGGDVRIDGAVLDAVQSAMIQLVRNALAHGIETPPQRRLAGKEPAGNVHIDVTRRGYHAYFRCRDDGAGIDLEAVRRAIAARGNGVVGGNGVPRNLQAMGTQELIGLLLEGGFSTSAAVSEIAGRGIGLNLVRESILDMLWRHACGVNAGPGHELRAARAAEPGSAASADDRVWRPGCRPAARCRAAHAAHRARRHPAPGRRRVDRHEGSHIPLLPLKLGARRDGVARSLTAVVIGNASGHYAITVDRLLGMEQVVLRPLPAMAPADPIVLGLCLDIEGNPRLVLDPEQFRDDRRNQGLHSALQSSSQAAALKSLHPILIVDDSLTTRMLECSILESAGFQVDMAASAEEGLELANRNNYSLFLVDVEMPGIDGFEFVARTRADPALQDTPCILVTSRNAPEDLQRGRACGASDYIVKGEFDQIRFLQRVTELVQPLVPPLVQS